MLRRRLPWLIVLLAVVSAAWMGYDATWPHDGEDIERAGGEEGDDPFLDGGDETWEQAWDEAPRLVGRGSDARRGEGPGGGGTGATPSAGTGAKALAGGRILVAFGGIVKGTDNRPVAGVTVTIRGKDTDASFTIETEADGRFAVEVPPGRYDLVLRGEGVGGLMLPAYLVDGATGLDVEFPLRRTYRLAVHLVREGLGVADANVAVVPFQGIGGEACNTDDAGNALFEEIVAGSYHLSISLTEREELRRRLDLNRDTELEIVVPPGVAIRGVVSNGDEGGPVPGALVTVSVRLSSGTWVTTSTETDVDGHYEMEVPRGIVGRFEVSARDFAPWPPRKQIRKVLQSMAHVGRGKPAERNVTLTHGLVLTGRVSDEKGTGVEGVELAFRPRRRGVRSGQSVRSVCTGEDGLYELSGVSPERYDVVVLTEGWFSDRALTVNVPSLPAGERFTYDVTVHGTIEVRGEVLHANRTPAVGARVWVTGGGRLLRAAHNAGRTLETFTDAGGGWRITDLPPEQGVVLRAALGALEARPKGIRTNELPAQPVRLLLAATVALKGMVVDASTRSPVPRARVWIRPRGAPGGRTPRTVTTDAEGEFDAFELIPGTWELTPSRMGYVKATPHSEDLDPDEREVEVTLYLDPGLAIAGVVVDLQGQPLANARVAVSGTTRDGRNVRHGARTKGDGQFRLTGFESGTYRLTAWRSGYRNTPITNLAGGEERLVVEMRPRPKPPPR